MFCDVDGNRESRRGTVSLFDGPSPEVRTLSDASGEQEAVEAWISERIRGGCLPHEIGIVVRSERELKRARAAVKVADVRGSDLDKGREPNRGSIAIGTMHLAKGLELNAWR